MKKRARITNYEGSAWTLVETKTRLRLMRDDTVVWWGVAPIPNHIAPLQVLLELSIDPT